MNFKGISKILVAFFTWTASLGKVFTLDNLCKNHIIVMDLCCACKKSGKTPDHLIHCDIMRVVEFGFSYVWS